MGMHAAGKQAATNGYATPNLGQADSHKTT